jgi:hypothetical protein
MSVKQISISLENLPGKFSEVIDYLSEHEIQIVALSVADAADLSTVRIVANQTEKTSNILRTHGYSVKATEVLAAEIPNRPGGLDMILRPLRETSVNIYYLYTCLVKEDKTVVIVGVDKLTQAVEVLKKTGVRMLDEDLYRL